MAEWAGIADLLAREAAAQRIPGFVAMATTADGAIHQQAAGQRGLGSDGPMTLDTVFRIASMTKALTSVAAMQLVEQGRLALDAPIGALLPALAAPRVLEGFDAAGAPVLRPARGPITLRHLLTHSAGYGYDTWNPELARAYAHAGMAPSPADWAWIAQAPLLFDPGTRWNYSIATDLVGRAVDAASGQTLDAYLRDHVCGPLGMHDTVFVPDADQRRRLAGMHTRQPAGSLLAIEHPAAETTAFFMGGGRALSTGPDYLRFLRMLLRAGELDGVRVLRPETVAEMGRNQIGDAVVTPLRSAVPARSNDADLFPGMVQKWGLGFLINTEPGPAGRSAGSLAWAGLFNTYYWIDPVRGVAGLVLTQILPFADAAALALLGAFEGAVYAAGTTGRDSPSTP